MNLLALANLLEKAASALRKAELELREIKSPGRSIEILDLPVLARNACRKLNVKTVEELSAKSVGDLLDLKNCGVTTVRIIQSRLAELGMYLSDECS